MSIAEKLLSLKADFDSVYEEGKNAGKQAGYDHFWDIYQNYGNRKNYRYAFYSNRWNDEIYKPKYPIVCNADSVAGSTIFDNARITDTLVPITIENGVADNAFVRCATLVTIHKLIVNNVSRFTNTFAACSALENITIEGSIDVNFSISATAVLTNDSVQSIMDHLKDLTGLDTQTLTLHQTVGEKLTEEQKAVITAKNWTLVY